MPAEKIGAQAPVSTPIASQSTKSSGDNNCFVEMKYGGQSIQIPCKAEEKPELEKEVKALVTEMDKKAKAAGVTPEQYMATLMQAVPPKGAGEKLNTTV